MKAVFLCDAIRTPIGRYGGSLSSVRTDDLAAMPIRSLRERYGNADWSVVDDVILGCANQAGEDNRNVARMAALLAGMPVTVPGVTVNRLCGSGLEAVAMAARSIATGEADMVIAGGVESMSRAPYVMSKSATPFARDAQMFDTTIGWRFVNGALRAQYGIDSMPETAENVAAAYRISPPRPGRVFAAQPSACRGRSACRQVRCRDLRRAAGRPTFGGSAWLDAASEDTGRRGCRSRTPRHGTGSGARHPEASRPDRSRSRCHRHRRIERGLCGAGACGAANTRDCGRCRARESERRRDRARPPTRCQRRASRDDVHASDEHDSAAICALLPLRGIGSRVSPC